MKYLTILGFLVYTLQTLSAQTFGNGNPVTFYKPIQDIETIDIQFNAEIIIDCEAKEQLTITIDENLKDLVGITIKNGKLTLDQVKWISPKANPRILIGAPNLSRVFQGTHSKTRIKNVKAADLSLEGNVGELIASGTVKNLNVNISGTDVNLKDLVIGTANINILDDSRVWLNQVNRIETEYANDDRIILLSQPEQYISNQSSDENKDHESYKPNPDLRFIQFKIKNNSWKRNHFVVVGPKRDGRTFSYGFAMMPGSVKSEKWSVGTRIYSEKNNKRTLLVTIKESNEGNRVPLFN